MKRKAFQLLSLLLVVTAFSLVLVAQPSNGKTSAKARSLTVGETLSYEGKFSKIIQGIAVADLTFTLANSPDGDHYVVQTQARSKGSLLRLFRYSFYQKFESTIDDDRFRVLKTVKRDEQKERIRDSEAVFDYGDRQVTFTETNPKEPMRAPRKIASEIKDDTHDLVSGIYALRLMPLAVGKVFELTVSDSGLVYRVPVRVTRREQQKSVLGKTMCFRLEPEVFGPGRMIDQKGSMIIWITDDARRIPVRSQINTEQGKIEVKLKQVTYNDTPGNTSAQK